MGRPKSLRTSQGSGATSQPIGIVWTIRPAGYGLGGDGSSKMESSRTGTDQHGGSFSLNIGSQIKGVNQIRHIFLLEWQREELANSYSQLKITTPFFAESFEVTKPKRKFLVKKMG